MTKKKVPVLVIQNDKTAVVFNTTEDLMRGMRSLYDEKDGAIPPGSIMEYLRTLSYDDIQKILGAGPAHIKLMTSVYVTYPRS